MHTKLVQKPDELERHERFILKLRYFVMWWAAMWAIGLGVLLPICIAWFTPATDTFSKIAWASFGIVMSLPVAVYVVGFFFVDEHQSIKIENKRFTTPEKIKQAAREALREKIVQLRNNALLSGEFKQSWDVTTLTMDEIKAVYQHAEQRGTYNVVFDFSQEFV